MAVQGGLLHIDVRQGEALRKARLDVQTVAQLAGRFRALSDSTRLGLALSLGGGRELCVCDLSWIAERPQNLTSHHMKVLKSEGIVSARKEGKMTMYQLTADGRQLVESALARADRP
jgi:DNA-binding transcriptional ArsR family regulator